MSSGACLLQVYRLAAQEEASRRTPNCISQSCLVSSFSPFLLLSFWVYCPFFPKIPRLPIPPPPPPPPPSITTPRCSIDLLLPNNNKTLRQQNIISSYLHHNYRQRIRQTFNGMILCIQSFGSTVKFLSQITCSLVRRVQYCQYCEG